MELIIFLIIILHKGMEKIIIKETGACSFKTRVELFLGSLFCRCLHKSIDLGTKCISVPWVSVYKCFLDCSLRTGIYICGIEICKSSIKEHIHHLFCLLNICAKSLMRESHKTKSKLGDFLPKII